MVPVEGVKPGDATVLEPGEGEVIEAVGVRVEVKTSAQESQGALSVVDYTAPPGFKGPAPHYHRKMQEAFFVLEGRLEALIDEEPRSLPEGGYAHVQPGVVHTWSNPHDVPVRFMLVFQPGGFERYFRELRDLIAAEDTWPPKDPSTVTDLAARHDTYHASP